MMQAININGRSKQVILKINSLKTLVLSLYSAFKYNFE